MKAYKIDVSASPFLSEAVQKKAFELGYNWSGGNKVQEFYVHYIRTEINGGMSSGSAKRLAEDYPGEWTSAIDFLKLKKEDTIKIDEHEVEFKDNGDISVGCKDISFKLLDKIYHRACKTKGAM